MTEPVTITNTQYIEFFTQFLQHSNDYAVKFRKQQCLSTNPYHRDSVLAYSTFQYFNKIAHAVIPKDITPEVGFDTKVILLKSDKTNVHRFTVDTSSLIVELSKHNSKIKEFTRMNMSTCFLRAATLGLYKDDNNVYRILGQSETAPGFHYFNNTLVYGKVSKMGEVPVGFEAAGVQSWNGAVAGALMVHLIKLGLVEEFMYPELEIKYPENYKVKEFLETYASKFTMVREH